MNHTAVEAKLDFQEDDGPRPEYPPHLVEWHQLCRALPYLGFLCDAAMREPVPPRPMKRDALAALVGSLACPDHAEVLRVLLVRLLRPALDDLVAGIEESLYTRLLALLHDDTVRDSIAEEFFDLIAPGVVLLLDAAKERRRR